MERPEHEADYSPTSIAVALPSFTHRFPITQNSQLRIYSYIQQEITIVRNVTKLPYIPVVKSLVTNNGQTCP
jgi:hypothetical protein